jgi:hypothetical protein
VKIMAIRERLESGSRWFGSGRGRRHWLYEAGVPGWTRTWHGYPCLHFAETTFPPVFDRKQELELLRDEARELERTLEDIREDIVRLENEIQEEK